MSISILRYVEVKIDNTWKPALIVNGKPHYNISNFSSIRSDLTTIAYTGYPKDISVEIEAEIRQEEYKSEVRYVSLNDIMTFYGSVEREMVSYISRTSGGVENPEKMSTHDLLVDLYKNIHTPFADIYDDYSCALYQWISLISEMQILAMIATNNHWIADEDVRIVFYMC